MAALGHRMISAAAIDKLSMRFNLPPKHQAVLWNWNLVKYGRQGCQRFLNERGKRPRAQERPTCWSKRWPQQVDHFHILKYWRAWLCARGCGQSAATVCRYCGTRSLAAAVVARLPTAGCKTAPRMGCFVYS